MSGRQLTKKEVTTLRVAIERLSDRTRPTWKMVERAAVDVLGRSFTRQALSANQTLAKAYSARVEAYRRFNEKGKSNDRDEVESPGVRRERLLCEENERLKGSIAEHERRWNAMVAHLHMVGVDVRTLPRSLPQLPREGR